MEWSPPWAQRSKERGYRVSTKGSFGWVWGMGELEVRWDLRGKSRLRPHHRRKPRNPRFPARDFGGNYRRGFQIPEEPVDGHPHIAASGDRERRDDSSKEANQRCFPGAGVSQLWPLVSMPLTRKDHVLSRQASVWAILSRPPLFLEMTASKISATLLFILSLMGAYDI